ncbi:MAG: protein kinase domain-containing protein [Gemmataceae bacterium]
MKQRLRCINGHEWELAVAGAEQTADFAPNCPVCKTAQVTLDGRCAEPAPAVSAGAAETLPPQNGHAVLELPLARVPGYQIQRELGRGGMGVVYLARQEKLNRLVALKMVLAGLHAGARDRDRFQREAETVARLHHPNIVQIYEVGEAEGRPYLALEYVDGGTLAERLQGTPLPAREAAQLMVPLARAIQAAHAAGIIHRDLKPGNILLQAPGPGTQESGPGVAELCPKITDFGLAKEIDSAVGNTQTGAVLGTPSYMAPEQASGQVRAVGPAADVYALGAILYELLTGRTPFLGATPLDTVMQVATDEPVRPRQLQPKCPADLETICLKCLQKEPRKRFATAGELADDLQRFLNGESIRARPVGPLERGWRWARRNPQVAALLAVLAAVVVGGFVIVFSLWRQSESRRVFASQQEGRAKEQEARAKANLLKAIEAVDRMMTRVVDERLAYVPQFEDERRQILEDAVAFYHSFLEQEQSDPALRREMGRAYQRLGKVFLSLGKVEKAHDSYREALRLQEQLTGEFPSEPKFRHDLAQTLIEQAIAYRMQGDVGQAASADEHARSLAEALVSEFPDDPSYYETLGHVQTQLGYLYFQKGQLDVAPIAFQTSIQVFANILMMRPGDFHARLELAKARTALGFFQLNINRFNDAEERLTPNVAELTNLLADFPEKKKEIEPALAEARLDLAAVYTLTNRAAKSDELLRLAMATFEQLRRDYPRSPISQFLLARGHLTSAQRARQGGNPAQAEASLVLAIALLEKLAHDNSEQFYHAIMLRQSYRDLSEIHRKEKKYAEAADDLRKAIGSAESEAPAAQRTGQVETELALFRMSLAELLADSGQLDEAVKEFDIAIDRAQAAGTSSPRLPSLLKALRVGKARILAFKGDHAAALAEGRRAFPTLDPLPPEQFFVYNLACVHALCVPAIERDEQLPTAERRRLADARLAEAISILRKLHAAGYFRNPQRVQTLRTDSDLNALRDQPDFRALVEEVVPKPPKNGAKN